MTIREAVPCDAAGIAQVHVESWRTTYPGIMPQEHLDALSVADFTQTWAERLTYDGPGQTHVFVAVDELENRIVGFVSGGGERSGDPDSGGEVYALYLLKSHQRQGLGRCLVVTLARRLSQLGYATLLIWVNTHNPARRFYESLGGVAVRTGQRTLNAVTYDDIGYGWDAVAFARLIGTD